MPSKKPTMKNCPALRELTGKELLDQLGEELLCPPSQLIEPKGRLPHKKLGLMRRFEEACPGWHVEPITAANLDAAYELERHWQNMQDNPAQLEFARRCFRNFAKLRLIGCLLWDGETPVGYSLSCMTQADGAYILVLRALAVPAGVTAVLYRETARLMLIEAPGLAWVNLGFLGDEAEMKNRLSYQPEVDKDSLRLIAKRQRAAIDPEDRCLWDSALSKKIISLKAYEQAKRVYTYLSVGSEVLTAAVVAHALLSGKEVAVPRCQGKEMTFCRFTDYQTLERDRFGILQPSASAPEAEPIDDSQTICIVPALLVTKEGYRLGYGGGYYDRFLAGYGGCSVTMAYPTMLRRSLPTEVYDRPVNQVLLP